MKRMSIFFALVVLLGSVPVPAQKIDPPPPPIGKILSVQDEDGSGYVWFNVFTGEFKCKMSEYKYTFTGKGEVKVDGLNVYLGSATDSYQIFVSVDIQEKKGMAFIEIYKSPIDDQPIDELFIDPDIGDNILD